MVSDSSVARGRKNAATVVAVVAFLFCLVFAGKLFESVNADEIVCIQSAISGKLHWYTTAGIKPQFFGKITSYYKLDTYEFKVPVRFNDGGHGTMIGSLNYELPLAVEPLTNLHIKYGSQVAIQKQLVETVTNKCVYMTGPLMSSKESYSEKRTSLIRFIEDQIVNGVYRTTQKDIKTKDPMTGTDKTVTVVEIVSTEGKPERQEAPVLAEYGIRITNFAVSQLPYDDTVEGQIKQQQDITMKVQTAIASAKEAEQRAITVAKEGEANAAKAKWEQEVVKAKAVTEAQQKFEVAKLEAKAAEQEKRKQILLGEGEAARKKLVMQADGALQVKLEAWKAVEIARAEALAKMQTPVVPGVVMGGDGRNAPSAADWLAIMGAKAARDLKLEVEAKK